MEKITDKIAALPPDARYFSLEFFPPKTAMGFSNLRGRLDRMARALRPLFINVTWGAGGSTAQKSLELAELCQRELGLTTCLHLTCTNMNRAAIDKALDDARALGIRNLLALRGDPPRRDEYRDELFDEVSGSNDGDGEPVQFNWAIDLVRYIRRRHGDYFCIGVSAYPEGHADESHPAVQSPEHDLPYLVEKVRAGADFIMTQLFFDVDAYDRFERRLREHPSGVFHAGLPIIPGLMPIQSYAMIRRTAKLSHAQIPDHIQAKLDALRGDDEKVKLAGVDILAAMVERLKEIKARTPGPQGFHFYTLNLEKAVSFIVERTGLIPPVTPEDDEDVILGVMDGTGPQSIGGPATADSAELTSVPRIMVSGMNGTHGSSHSARGGATIGSSPHDHVIVPGGGSGSGRGRGSGPSHPDYETTPFAASLPAGPINTRANTLAISEGEGSLGREATWDDFPNGRWGDARSPAYGEIDGYGVSLHMGVAAARQKWGTPTRRADVDELFLRYIRGELDAIPWSEEELRVETGVIRLHLEALNARSWWTVASQPAVDGVRSEDETFGWGPENGFVFQKAFVEFFVSKEDWEGGLRSALVREAREGRVCFYACSWDGEYQSSDHLQTVGYPYEDEEDEEEDEDEDGFYVKDNQVNGERSARRPRRERIRQQFKRQQPHPTHQQQHHAQPRAASTNAVTWGTFPGKEIVTPTIIEEVSFRAWSDEAFGIWREWAQCYGRGSPSGEFLDKLRQQTWLVNVIHHEYRDPDALWELLKSVRVQTQA